MCKVLEVQSAGVDAEFKLETTEDGDFLSTDFYKCDLAKEGVPVFLFQGGKVYYFCPEQQKEHLLSCISDADFSTLSCGFNKQLKMPMVELSLMDQKKKLSVAAVMTSGNAMIGFPTLYWCYPPSRLSVIVDGRGVVAEIPMINQIVSEVPCRSLIEHELERGCEVSELIKGFEEDD